MALIENVVSVQPHSEILCGAALPGAFVPQKNIVFVGKKIVADAFD